ncbi:MAG: bifunctional phosphoglucose/phosphomannose isomerase [Ignavibacteriales bacterium CG_4_9_14_3_um_filter_30_11]|nr:MAG: bifunctional phosphoglucose/phosphomannose isomerase [Ignavibacteriales bacterium CG_4_9_14_3_um_filter_30_11]
MNIKDFVSKYDSENQFDVMKNYYNQAENAWKNDFKLDEVLSKDILNIVITGLGGSAIAGDLIREFLSYELKIPLLVSRNYTLPKFIDKNSLCIFSSYSGNTEETIEALNASIKLGCKIICVTTGGEIEKIAKTNNLPCILLSEGYQPRYAIGSSFFTLLKIFVRLKFIIDQDEIVKKIISNWKDKGTKFSKEGNDAYNFARNLIGYIPVIYSGADLTSALGNRFKCQLNENSKLNAFHNVIPEMNHNEIIGWETFESNQFKTIVINILDDSYHPQVKKRFEIVSELIKKLKVEILNIDSKEKSFKLRLMDLIYFTDWVSYYLGILRQQDPSEIDNIKYLKIALVS